MKTLISILSHDAAEHTFKRHLPYWKEHEREGAELVFWSPADAALRVKGFVNLEVGKAAHHGKEAIKRFRTILEHMAGTGYDRHVFMEYDSLILGPLPQLKGDFAGNIFRDMDGAKEGWLGTTFVHPPFIADGNAIRKISAEFNKMPLDIEQGMWDRALGLAVERANLTLESWITSGYGYARNTIEPEHFDELKKAIITGSHALHGVKTPECFAVIQAAWNLRHQIENLEKEGFEVKR